jgi:hypothetical protein
MMTDTDPDRTDQSQWVSDIFLVALGTILTRELLSRPLTIETGGILLLFWCGVAAYTARSHFDWDGFDVS